MQVVPSSPRVSLTMWGSCGVRDPSVLGNNQSDGKQSWACLCILKAWVWDMGLAQLLPLLSSLPPQQLLWSLWHMVAVSCSFYALISPILSNKPLCTV